MALYEWLETYHAETGSRAVPFAYKGNLSNGWMFPAADTYRGGKVDEDYVELRAKWEPHNEVTQIKGDGGVHPALSPDDEFADYENWDAGNLNLTELKAPDMLGGEYAREALMLGLKLEAVLGTNPYKLGMAGATDSHTALATADEESSFSKSVSLEPSPTRFEHPFIASDSGRIEGHMLVESGYTAVWATKTHAPPSSTRSNAAKRMPRSSLGWRCAFSAVETLPTTACAPARSPRSDIHEACQWAATCARRTASQGRAF